MGEFEGKIEETDRGLKEMRPNKDGSVSWKYGLKVGGIWHSVFGSKAEVEAIKKEVDAGGDHAKGTYKLSKDGKYRNIEEVVISQTGVGPKGETNDEKAMREEREKTRPERSLSGAHQGQEKPREERIGVEDQENEEDQHYLKEWDRACGILRRALAEKSKNFISVEEQSAFKLAVFEKRASPLVYLRENIRRARAEAGVK